MFPSHYSLPAFPFPCSLPEAVSGVVTHTSPLLSKSVHSLPSSSLPTVPCPLSILTIMSPPSFPIDDYVPALFPYWWLCSRPLSLFSIMLLLPLPIFDYALTLSVPDVLMLLLHYCWKCNLCIMYLSKQTGQLLFMHRIMFQIPTLFLMQKSPLWKWVLEPS